MKDSSDLSTLVLDSEKFSSPEEFKEKLFTLLDTLTTAGYEVLITKELDCIWKLDIVHDPNSDDDDWGCDRFMLVTSDEEDGILSRRIGSEANKVELDDPDEYEGECGEE